MFAGAAVRSEIEWGWGVCGSDLPARKGSMIPTLRVLRVSGLWIQKDMVII